MVRRHSKSTLKRTRKGFEERSGEPRKFIVFSLIHFDQNQGQSFDHWEQEKILAKLFIRLREISGYTVIEAISKDVLKDYGKFPENTEFKFPIYIHQGVNWASLKIQGKERVAGYIEDNIFYIVFLDKDHKFWLCEKKHT